MFQLVNLNYIIPSSFGHQAIHCALVAKTKLCPYLFRLTFTDHVTWFGAKKHTEPKAMSKYKINIILTKPISTNLFWCLISETSTS